MKGLGDKWEDLTSQLVVVDDIFFPPSLSWVRTEEEMLPYTITKFLPEQWEKTWLEAKKFAWKGNS